MVLMCPDMVRGPLTVPEIKNTQDTFIRAQVPVLGGCWA